MKVLVAAAAREGHRASDFTWTVEGELVRLPGAVCDCPDCGCDRSMAGLASSKATTVFRVLDHPTMTSEHYRQAFCDALIREGWIREGDDVAAAEVREWADQHLTEAARWPDGTLLELTSAGIRQRRPARSG